MIDLHTHSTYSDGSLTPQELVEAAVNAGLTYLALTDHDTIAGINSAIEFSKTHDGPFIIPGIEFSCFHRGEDIHILAYFIPLDNCHLDDFLKIIHKKREERFVKVVDKLASFGFPISPGEVDSFGPGGMKMCPQIIKVLNEKRVITDISQAKQFIDEYLSIGGKAYIKHDNDPREIIDFCHEIGVPTSLAHPHKLRNLAIIKDVIEMGVKGLEYYYPNVPDESRKIIFDLISENKLLATGGSDFHGIYSDSSLSDGNVPDEVLEDLERAYEAIGKS